MTTYRVSVLLARALVLILGLIFSVTVARADVAVIVPPHLEHGGSSEQLDQAVEELTRLLKVQGFDVISGGQAGAAAEVEQQRGAFPTSYDPLYCPTPACANEFRKIFDATFAVQLTLFGDASQAANVSVVFTEAANVFFTGTANVEGRDIRAAVRTACEDAREKQRDGVGPWLRVTGLPEGATILLDGSTFGHLPSGKRRIEPGPHRLEIRAENYASTVRNLEIPDQIEHVEHVDVRLVETKSLARATRDRTLRTPWDWALGGALGAIGIVHLVAGVYQKSIAGDCAEHTGDVCTQYYGDQHGAARENLLIGFGAASIAAGALVIGIAPIGRLRLRSGVDRASLELSGEF